MWLFRQKINLYSDVYRDGNACIAGSGNGNKLSTNWSNGVVFQVDTSINKLNVTENGVTLASLQLSGGRIMGDSFIPAYDGSNRIFAFSTNGGQKTWTIPSYISATGLQLYRLTSEGRVYEG